MATITRLTAVRKEVLEKLIDNKNGLTFIELKNTVKSSKEELLEVLNELLNYTPLVGIQGEKYFFRG